MAHLNKIDFTLHNNYFSPSLAGIIPYREESQNVDSLRDQKKLTRIIGSVSLKLKLNFLLELYLMLNSNLSTTAFLSDPKVL